MLVLTFQIYDSFFINDIFYQIIPGAEENSCTLRAQNNNSFLLKNDDKKIDIYPNCKAKLCSPIQPNAHFKIAFDAPREISIIRSSIAADEEFQDELVVSNTTERTIDQLLEEEFYINPEFSNLFVQHCLSSRLEE